MDEDKEVQRKTRKHRKRKLRESSPIQDEDSFSGNYLAEEPKEEEKVRKKRGRKPKEKEPPVVEEDDIPETKTELLQIYSVVEHLKNSNQAKPFMDRPDGTMNGMTNYYEIIKNPMWLREIDSKYQNGQYSSATEVAADIRRMFENCYEFWGPKDELTKQGVKLEQRFEQKLLQLSPKTQKLCSLSATHGNIMGDDNASQQTGPSTSQGPRSKRGLTSRLLEWVLDGKEAKPNNVREIKCQSVEKEYDDVELSIWEAEYLIPTDITEQINSMPEFPEIGHFLQLVYNVLNIEPILQTEIERMLILPEISSTLATVMASLLLPPLARSKLDSSPPMPYSIWTRKLSNKVNHWYKQYHAKRCNLIEVFEAIGIEPQFWLVMKENPLKENQFQDLSLLEKVWLLKGLCGFVMHNQKSIQDCVNNLESEDMREMNIGRDNKGYSYHYFPLFSDIRIYRMSRVPEKNWELFDSGIQTAMTIISDNEDDIESDKNIVGFTRRSYKTPKYIKKQYCNFKMVADTLDGIRSLIDELSNADIQSSQGHGTNANLIKKLNSIITQLEPMEDKILSEVYDVRIKMREEWLEYTSREPGFEPGLPYWQSKDKLDHSSDQSIEKCSDKETMESKPLISSERPDDERRDFRERRSKRESQLKMLVSNDANDSESEEEYDEFFDDDSSEEWHAPGSKPKKNKRSPRKSKKITDVSDKEDKSKNTVQVKEEFNSETLLQKLSASVTVSNTPQSSKKTDNNTDENFPVTIKKETPDPEVDKFSAVSKSSVSKKHNTQVKNSQKSSQNKLPGSNVIQTLVPKLDVSKIKRSASPEYCDIVCISDTEDESDVKPSKEQLLKVGNVKTLIYSLPQNNTGGFMNNQTSVISSSPIYNVQPNTFIAQPNTVIPVQTQLQPQQITYTLPGQTVIRPNQILSPQQTVMQMQNPPTGLSPNQNFVVIQQPGNNALPPTGVATTGNNAFPASTGMQTVNWFNQTNASPISTASTQNPLRMSSPRQRGQNYNIVQARSPQQSMRGAGNIRSPNAPVRMTRMTRTPNSSPQFNMRSPKSGVRGQGVGVRSPMNLGIRTPGTPGMGSRTPTIIGQRTPTAMIRSPVTVGRGGNMRGGAIRNLFSQTPPKQAFSNSSPDIEGELKVAETDNGNFGYVVVLADGGKISLTSEQLAQIRSDNGGILPKRCKVPLKPKINL